MIGFFCGVCSRIYNNVTSKLNNYYSNVKGVYNSKMGNLLQYSVKENVAEWAGYEITIKFRRKSFSSSCGAGLQWGWKCIGGILNFQIEHSDLKA